MNVFTIALAIVGVYYQPQLPDATVSLNHLLFINQTFLSKSLFTFF